MKDDSLSNNTFTIEQFYMSQKRLPKTMSTLSQNGQPFFAKELKNFVYFIPYDFIQNLTSMWSKYLSSNVWRDFRLSMSVMVT